jgi:CheY-like chemotaxis protein
MTLGPKILIVDDDPNCVRMYLEILKEEGYTAESAANRAEALARLDAGDWAIVLLDQRLRGADGPDSGLDLLDEVSRRSPGAKSIVITAYADSRAVERAFALGAFDYLEKTDVLDALLRIKLRSAWDSVRAREAGALARDQLDEELRATWRACIAEPDRHRKGALLEDAMDTLFRTMPGFVVVNKRRSNDVEELDLVVRNESPDPFWSHEGPYLLVECKNWVAPVGRREFDVFRAKMNRRHQRCRLGIFVAIGGFTEPFLSVATLGAAESPELVLPVDRADLESWVDSSDRVQFIKALHAKVTTAIDAK